MAEVRPLNALHYNLAAVPSLAEVVAPPYDVIDEPRRAELLARSPFNVVEIDLPRTADGGDPYEHAAETLEEWTLQGILAADREPALWALTQEYSAPDGSRQTRRGLLCRVRVTDYGPGLVRPHERTQPGPKQDRLRLTEATRHNLSPIFSLHEGDAWRHVEGFTRNEPWAEVTDDDGTVNRVWRIGDPEAHRAVSAELAESELLIADGHHRYETARTYADAIGGDGAHRYTLMALVSLADPGLTVFGYHRLLTDLGDSATQAALREAILANFDAEEVALDALDPAGEPGIGVFGYVDAHHRKGYRLRLKRLGGARASDPGCLGGLPDPRRGDPRGARAPRRARDERRRDRGQARDRLHGLRRAGARRARRRRRRRLPDAPDPGRAGPRRRRRGRDDAAEVDLLLPEAAHRDRLQPAELTLAGRWSASTPRRATTARRRSGTAAGCRSRTPRTEAYGALDEAGSALGIARSLCADDDAELAADILRLQDDLFIAGAELATAPEAAERLVDGVSRVTAEMAAELERLIDRYLERVELPPKFVIPGGTTISAQLDLARAVIRRAERRTVALAGQGGQVADELLRFLNRASDAAYAMARFADLDSPELFAGRERSEPKA